MLKFRDLFIISILAMTSMTLQAQENEVKVGVRTGYNAVYGGFVAASLETKQNFCDDFSLTGGVQYNSIGKTALEARPSYNLNFDKSRLSAEVLLAYTNISDVNSFAAGAGADFSGRYLGIKLGYYYRLYGGRGDRIAEPFNIYYELRVNLLTSIERWDLQLAITNNETFELERHYQPSYIAQCSYYPGHKLGISAGIGCKPAGAFNLSSDYYQSFLKLGLCYRW